MAPEGYLETLDGPDGPRSDATRRSWPRVGLRFPLRTAPDADQHPSLDSRGRHRQAARLAMTKISRRLLGGDRNQCFKSLELGATLATATPGALVLADALIHEAATRGTPRHCESRCQLQGILKVALTCPADAPLCIRTGRNSSLVDRFQ